MGLQIKTTPGYNDLYVNFQGTSIGIACVVGTGLDAGWYSITDDQISQSGLAAGTWAGSFQHGNFAAPSSGDSVEYFFTGFVWNGTVSTFTSFTAFTTREEIERLFSVDAVDLRLDDGSDADNQADIMNEIVDEASGIVWQYLWMSYVDTDAARSLWVRRRSTWIGAFLLSQRRGNPAQYLDRYEQIIAELQAVFARQLFIPGLNVLVTNTPTLSNYIIDNRGLGPVVRVTHDSVGTYDGQRTTMNYPFPEII